MINKTRYTDGEIDAVFDQLLKDVIINLSEKQKIILISLSKIDGNITATKFVDNLSGDLKCAKSTLWNIIRSLRTLGFVNFGSDDLTLTITGKILVMEVNANAI
ncbi:MAG TPA: hypothetical protein VJI68_02385 [Candidatus Nanoarchaeia archaeon]|nr:hypothetical protein [Candidatus Nanoarchaeia archaeon]